MSDEDKKEIKRILKKIENKTDNIDDILNSREFSYEEIYIKVVKEIIKELNSLNAIIISKNTKINFSKYDKKYLYDVIHLFMNMNMEKITKDGIKKALTKENIYIIMNVLINVNKYNLLAENILEFNLHIKDMLSYIIQNNSELLMDNMLFYKNSILPKFLLNISVNRKGREFMYDIQRNILIYIKDKNKYFFYIEFMKNIVDNIFSQLNERNIESIVEEFLEITYIYKNRINIISKSMKKLLIKIFSLKENDLVVDNRKDDNCNDIITNILRYCFNRIVFTYSSNINQGNNQSINIKNKNDFQFNVDFMNFLLEIYSELIDNKLKNSYTVFIMELFLCLDNSGNGINRYKWIMRQTKYKEIFLESLIKMRDSKILSLYLNKIVFISMNNNNCFYKPYYDINFLFSKILEIFNSEDVETNKKFFYIIASQIVNLININKEMIKIIFIRCDIFNQCLLIFNSNNFSKEIKYNILEFLEKIISLNNNKDINYKFNFPITEQIDLEENFDLDDINTYGLKYKLYLLFLNSDLDSKVFTDNINKIIDNIKFYADNNKFFEMFIFIDVLLKSFLIAKNINYINEFCQNTIDKINNIFLEFPFIILNNENIDSEETVAKFLIKYIKLIIAFIYSYNLKIIEIKRSKLFQKSKKIFTENSMIKIFQNIFERTKNLHLKNKILSLIFCYNYTENKIDEIQIENKNILIQNFFLIRIFLKALYNINDFNSISNIYQDLLKSIDFTLINVKNIIVNDIVSFTINLLINSYGHKDIDNEPDIKECCEKAIELLKIIVNFLTQSSLIKYLYSIFHIFYETISDLENKEGAKNKKIILLLFNILKDSLLCFYNKQKQNYQYLSLSKKIYSNPFIYNIFYINNLQIKENIINYNFDIRINSFDNIDNFCLLNLVNEKLKQNLFISLDSEKNLTIGEKNLISNEVDILITYNNIDNYLLIDNKFHNISIIIDKEKKSITLLIDSKDISSKNELVNYKNFIFDNIGLSVGYDYKEVDNFNNKINKENSAIIDISNILILNFQNENDAFLINKQKENLKYQYDMDYIIEYLCHKKKVQQIEFILAEICFDLNKIKIINSKYIKKDGSNNIIDEYLFDKNKFNNKYIYYMDIFLPLQNERISKFYMCSLNANIEEYFSSNHILSIQNLNKVFFQNIFSEELNIFISSSNYYFVDFLIGFFLDIEKRRELLEDNAKISSEEKLIFLGDEFIIEFTLIIFQIIFSIKNKYFLKNYISEADKYNIPVKIRIFFKNNAYLLNNQYFLNKFIEILLQRKEIFLIFSIHVFVDLIIFSLLNPDNQNLVLINIYSLFDTKKEEIKENDPMKQYFIEKINKNEELNPLLVENILENLIKIILYYPLSNEEIKGRNNEKQIDIIIAIIKSINKKISQEEYLKIINKTKLKIYDFNENKENDKLETFFEKNKKLITKENSIINNEIIKNQIDAFDKVISEFTKGLLENNIDKKKKHEDLNDNNMTELNDNNNDKYNDNNKISKNNFGQYLWTYFKFVFRDYFGDIRYEKYRRHFYRHIFLNFKEYRNKLGINKYTWFITGKSSYCCFQNKLFLRENYIQSFPSKKNKLQSLLCYKYDNNLKRFKKLSVQLQRLFIFDKISKDNPFINSFQGNNIKGSYLTIENCLLINRIYKTLSLFILQKDCIYILTNIFIDKENHPNICYAKPDFQLWCIKNEEYLKELEKYIIKNEEEFNNILEEERQGSDKEIKIKFGLNKNYKFSLKYLKVSEISEMYKTSFLQVPNSIEIITNKGKNYFFCFNIDRRDNVFYAIIDAIGDKYSNKNKNNTKIVNILKRTHKANSNEIFYMKNCPSYFYNMINNKAQKIFNYNLRTKMNKKELYNKVIIEKSALISELASNWAKNKISNYDYLLFLNIIAERSLTNLCQYVVLPLIIIKLDQAVFNHFNKFIYRDLSLPLFACYPVLTNNYQRLKDKVFNYTEIGNIYHSGIFYSTYSFVAYYLIRQHPFSEIHLELQGGEFDLADRLFIGQRQLASLEGKNQELIPFLFTLPEMYININNYLFGNSNRIIKGEIIQENVSDFILPNWAENDQRKFTLYLKKLLESKNVSQNLHSWIDLIFGYKMLGMDSIKSFNTYRGACYEPSKEEIEEAYSEGTLNFVLTEKNEMGYMGKQLFKKQHKKKEVISEGVKESENSILDKVIHVKNLKLTQLNVESNLDNKVVKINDIIIDTSNDYIKSFFNKKSHYFQGGISSLKTVMNVLSNESNIQQNKNINYQKLINSFEKESKFIFLDKKCILLGEPNNKVILKYSKTMIKIIYINFDICSLYYLNETGNISIIIANNEGSKLYIGFDNGNIILYKIKVYENEKDIKKESNLIYPFKNSSLSNKDINNINFLKKNKKNEIEQPPIIVLQKIITKNKFIRNNIHIPSKIRKLGLDEKNNVLIALTNTNIIYIISLNDNFKLINTISYFTHFDCNYKMIDILTFSDNGDFLIYSSSSVHLFSINGVPLCELDLLKEYEDISKISYCLAVFNGDILLFTGHKDGSIIIWKMKTKRSDKDKKFLQEYYYNYSLNFDMTNIKDYELRRRFEIILKIEQNNDNTNIPIKYMSLSNDMNYMLIVNQNKNISVLNLKIEEDNKNEVKESHNNKAEDNTIINICNICKKEFRDSKLKLNNMDEPKIKENNKEIIKKSEFEIVDKDKIMVKIFEEKNKAEDENICDNCLKILENYLYY